MKSRSKVSLSVVPPPATYLDSGDRRPLQDSKLTYRNNTLSSRCPERPFNSGPKSFGYRVFAVSGDLMAVGFGVSQHDRSRQGRHLGRIVMRAHNVQVVRVAHERRIARAAGVRKLGASASGQGDEFWRERRALRCCRPGRTPECSRTCSRRRMVPKRRQDRQDSCLNEVITERPRLRMRRGRRRALHRRRARNSAIGLRAVPDIRLAVSRSIARNSDRAYAGLTTRYSRNRLAAGSSSSGIRSIRL